MDNHSQITESIFISDWYGSLDINQLTKNNIKYVLCLNYENKKTDEDIDLYNMMGIEHKYIMVKDRPYANIIIHFNDIIKFLQNEYKGNILVHCSAGVSRSTTAVIAYLCSKIYNKSAYYQRRILPLVVSHVKKRRVYTNPNHGFMRQLFEFETQLKKTQPSMAKRF